jgi:orotidine-5'-phosphate decarboxylase
MNRANLIAEIKRKKSFLCVGLDPDILKLPAHLSKDAEGVKEFCLKIIAQTIDSCVSYKFNLAFFEALGWQGMKVFEEIVAEIPKTHLIIADAKRGDIGNTSELYARAFFEKFNCDALTINPYMGSDSVKPFLNHTDKWAIVLGLTSNEGAKDFELEKIGEQFLFEKVLKTCSEWGSKESMMFVIGATQATHFARIRQIIPQHFLLIPGVGAQGGSLDDVCKGLLNDDIGILVNSSREIIYASKGDDFAIKAGEKAMEMAEEMRHYFSS